MLFSAVLDRFAHRSPLSVMARGLLERALLDDDLDRLFTDTADHQYCRSLLFSTTVDLMSVVVLGSQPSIHAAFQSLRERIPVSITSVYNKLDGIEPQLSAALVRHTANQLTPLIEQLGGRHSTPLPKYRIKVLDGNHLAATEHRLSEMRSSTAGPLPGLALVCYDLALGLVVDVWLAEDAHAQERSLLKDVLPTVCAGDVWIADRNFCTHGFLSGIAARQGAFVIREHAKLNWEEVTPPQEVGKREQGEVWTQQVQLLQEDGSKLLVRRMGVRLPRATRKGEREIVILTNLPEEDADAWCVQGMYRQRWEIENLFRELKEMFNNEIKTLCYPKAALFGFCVGLAASNVMATVRGALRGVHGEKKTEELSGYALALRFAHDVGHYGEWS